MEKRFFSLGETAAELGCDIETLVQNLIVDKEVKIYVFLKGVLIENCSDLKRDTLAALKHGSPLPKIIGMACSSFVAPADVYEMLIEYIVPFGFGKKSVEIGPYLYFKPPNEGQSEEGSFLSRLVNPSKISIALSDVIITHEELLRLKGKYSREEKESHAEQTANDSPLHWNDIRIIFNQGSQKITIWRGDKRTIMPSKDAGLTPALAKMLGEMAQGDYPPTSKQKKHTVSKLRKALKGLLSMEKDPFFIQQKTYRPCFQIALKRGDERERAVAGERPITNTNTYTSQSVMSGGEYPYEKEDGETDEWITEHGYDDS